MKEQVLAAIVMGFIALTIGTAVVLRGPIGKAIAQWIASWGSPEHKAMEAKWAEVAASRGGASPAEVADLRADVEDLQRQLADVQERLDFTERVLARRDDRAMLPEGGGREDIRLIPTISLGSLQASCC